MEMMYAALLIHKAGQPVNEENMKKVLEAAGANADTGRIKAVVSSLEGANIDEIIEKAAAVAAAPAPVAGGAAPAAKKEEKPKEDEKKSEEEAAAGLAGLFG